LSQDNLRTYLTINRKTLFVNLGPGLVKHLSPYIGYNSEWMAFRRSPFAHRFSRILFLMACFQWYHLHFYRFKLCHASCYGSCV